MSTLFIQHHVECTCKKGCSACCKQLIALSMPECLAIKPYIESLSKEDLNNLKRDVLAQCDILEKNNLTYAELNRLDKDEKELQEKYFKLNMPCVFLNTENGCSVYSVRPSLCWSYRNYGDPVACSKSYEVETTIKFGDWEHRAFERILTARPVRKGLYFLPFAVKEMMGW